MNISDIFSDKALLAVFSPPLHQAWLCQHGFTTWSCCHWFSLSCHCQCLCLPGVFSKMWQWIRLICAGDSQNQQIKCPVVKLLSKCQCSQRSFPHNSGEWSYFTITSWLENNQFCLVVLPIKVSSVKSDCFLMEECSLLLAPCIKFCSFWLISLNKFQEAF